VIDADCAGSAAGAVLQQWQSGQLRVIAYASRALSAAERNYCVTRKEQLAIVYGLKQFRPYVLGHRTVVRTDHAALIYLKTAKEPVGQQARWLDFIAQFDIDLQYRKGSSHANADGLSRRPCDPPDRLCKQCRRPSELVGDPVGGPLSPCSAGRGAVSPAVPESSADQPGRLSDEPGHQRLNAVTTRRRARNSAKVTQGLLTPMRVSPVSLLCPSSLQRGTFG